VVIEKTWVLNRIRADLWAVRPQSDGSAIGSCTERRWQRDHGQAARSCLSSVLTPAEFSMCPLPAWSTAAQ